MNKKINNIIIFIFSLLAICFFIKDFNLGHDDRYFSDLSLILVLILPKLFRNIFKFKISYGLEFAYLLFVIFAHFLGSIVNLYNITWWYDLLAHFVSGIVVTILGIIVLKYFKMDNNKLFNIIFIIAFNLMVASLWEFVEFGSDLILKGDVQHNLTTGVRDTMEDMLIAFLGSIIVTITYYFEKDNGIINKIINLLK